MSRDGRVLAWPLDRSGIEPRPADRVAWLIDNADAYRAIVTAIRLARDTIWISQLALDADCVAYDVVPSATTPGSSTTIVHELLDATRRGVEVRVLLNASLLLDTVKPLRTYLAGVRADSSRIRVRGVSAFPQLLHAKMVLVDDDTAILVGSPFANGYWDDARHAPTDARRPMRELGGRPVHDISVRLAGRAVRTLRDVFATMWNGAADVADGDRERLASTRPGQSAPEQPAMRVVRTAPDDGPMEILPALLDGIEKARSLVYIEHQYLSARPVADALERALARHRSLEIIIVLNQNPDVTAYRGWQNARFRESGLLGHPRVGLFTLWTSAVDAPHRHRRLNQVFVHSKVVAIDDRWALLGSANLDGVSLHSYGDDFSSAIGRRIFRGVRNFDVGLVVDAKHADTDATEQVCGLRSALWREHLGSAFHAAGPRPVAGWLPLWRSVARRNAAELGTQRPAPFLNGPFILPYSTRSTPRAQLADVGVLFAPGAIELCFEPSWLEVHLSPSWVRNMFG
jgi:phosphatidylserine/phosphatidylglycerophosphate/cardiolipin synthase-like enzyme